MRRWILARTWFLVSLILVGLCPRPAEALGKKYRAESYTSDVRLAQDGTLQVRETIRVRFEGGPFTFFYRGVPKSGSDRVEIISGSDSISVRERRSEASVTWHFSPTKDATRTFTLEYAVHGAVAVEKDHLRLRWTPFPGNRAYPIDAAEAVLRLPAPDTKVLGLATRGRGFKSRPIRCEVRPGEDGAPAVVLESMPLSARETVTITLDLASGGFQVFAPAWQQQTWRWQKQAPNLLLISGFVLLIGIVRLLILRSQLRAQRHKSGEALSGGYSSAPFASSMPSAPSAPPDDLAAPLAGALGHGAGGLFDALACLFELAQRGIVRIDGVPRRWRFGSASATVRRIDSAQKLDSWESVLLDGVFQQADSSGSVPWSKAQEGMTKRLKDFSRELMNELERRGEIDPDAREGRRKLYRASYFSLAISCAVFIGVAFLIHDFGPAVLAIPLAGTLVAVIGIAFAGTFPLWTSSGAGRGKNLRLLARSVRATARQARRVGAGSFSVERFHSWLPYATALKFCPEWLKAGKALGYAPPRWFVPLAGSEGDLVALMAVVAAVSASAGAGGVTAGHGGAGGSSGAG